ncbi:CvpA family protein [Methylosoma difficile]
MLDNPPVINLDTLIWIDYTIIVLIAIYALSGLLRGFGLVCFSVVCWLIAIMVGLFFCGDCAFVLTPHISNPSARIAAAFVLLFLCSLIVGLVVRLLLGEWINNLQPSFLSRIGGLLLGIGHGLVAVNLVIVLAGLSALPSSPWWGNSKLIPPFQAVAIWLNNNFPSELAKFAHFH